MVTSWLKKGLSKLLEGVDDGDRTPLRFHGIFDSLPILYKTNIRRSTRIARTDSSPPTRDGVLMYTEYVIKNRGTIETDPDYFYSKF